MVSPLLIRDNTGGGMRPSSVLQLSRTVPWTTVTPYLKKSLQNDMERSPRAQPCMEITRQTHLAQRKIFQSQMENYHQTEKTPACLWSTGTVQKTPKIRKSEFDGMRLHLSVLTRFVQAGASRKSGSRLPSFRPLPSSVPCPLP